MSVEENHFSDRTGGGETSNSFLLPGTNGLVPLNPSKWPAHAAATAFTLDFPTIENPELKMLESNKLNDPEEQELLSY